MKQEYCNNCEFPLTETNVRLATEDAGLPQDELTFYCPSYVDRVGCLGAYPTEDTLPAYWLVTGRLGGGAV